MIPDGLTTGDTAEIEFELSAIGTVKTVAGLVTDIDGSQLTMKVAYPTRTLEYTIDYNSPEGEQVEKVDENGRPLGEFGPLLSIMRFS